MEKKEYKKPEMEITKFETEDVIYGHDEPIADIPV